jgi:hypothetical protein
MVDGSSASRRSALPPRVADLLWEYEADVVDPERNRELLFARILSRGDWRSITWLRESYGDAAVREWLIRTRGRHLDRRAVRLWQAIWGLSGEEVDAWLAAPHRRIWDERTAK